MDHWSGVGLGDDDAGIDAEELTDWRQSGRDATIFLVDTTKPMTDTMDNFDDNEDKGTTSYFQVALKAVSQTLKNKVFNAPNDYVGCLLYGTEKHEDVRDFEHLSVLLPLQCPSAKAISSLDEDTEADTIRKNLGHSPDFSLHEALWQCQSMFANTPAKVGSKKIIIITREAEPHAGNKAKIQQALQKARDLKDTGIYLDVIGLGSGFNLELFFYDLIQLADDEDADLTSKPVSKLDQLNRVLRMRIHKKRSVGRVHFQLGEGVKLAVSTYNFVQKAYKPTKMRLSKDTNEEIKVQRKFIHPETGALLMPSEINKFQEYGGKSIEFTQDECKAVTLLDGNVGLRLCGFKPLESLKLGHFVRSGYFIYPAEDMIKGSRKLFAALLKRCLARQVVPVCAYKARDSSGPSFVALLPQDEDYHPEDGSQISPPGFHLAFLPFADDVRAVPQVNFVDSDPDQVASAKRVIERLKMKAYGPEAFKNPDLQAHYTLIESLALSKEDVEIPNDDTLPDLDRMDKALAKNDTAQMFIQETGLDRTPMKKPTGGKRKTDQTAEPKIKKVKEESDTIDMAARVKSKGVEKLTVADLKAFLTSVNVNVAKMKKADLVKEVYNYHA